MPHATRSLRRNLGETPAAFLPVLESTGLMVGVGDWVVRRAALDCQHWLNAGLAPIRIAVNISPSQLRQRDFVDSFLKALNTCSQAGAGLDIAITEGSLHEELAPEVAKLKVLRNAGVRIAIDDFGTGYSCLSRLAKLPIDTLKIDRRAAQGLRRQNARQDDHLPRPCIPPATVAERVEAQDQLDFLWQAGCDQAQGFLHSHPLPRSEFMSLMQHGRGQFVLPPELARDSEDTRAKGV